ncbi:n-acetyltransferase GNAT family [Fusarium beomiforme]|uniref:N-acetyltransferase GNAT family n=1 Tax=Fusarium beomiforme TaxID=44412 RepID=A0A9P5ARW4_9HYPO|nr:n-acetyltransferase GNAT family [Fusarium beomiforme]
MSDSHFRIATEDDAPRLQELLEAAFRFKDAHIDWIGSPELAETFQIDISVILDRIIPEDSKFIVASDTPNGPIIGCVNVLRKAPDYGRLALLAVDPTLQRGGLGRKLVAYGEEYLTKDFGVSKIGLNALHTRKGLIRWYEKLGYVKTGEMTELKIERFTNETPIILAELDKTFA